MNVSLDPCWSHDISVVILAFVKSEGKKANTTVARSGSASPADDENTPLINDNKTSLKGSMGDRVV